MKKENDFLTPIHESNKSKAFIKDKNIAIASADAVLYNNIIESPEYAEAYKKLVDRVLPKIGVREPESFAVYGKAEKYYSEAFSYIYRSYPYDGSALEKVKWSLSASVVDLAVLQHEYPLETGHIAFSADAWGTRAALSGIYGLSDNPEYIKFSGGPYVGSVLDASTNRESSLKLDPSKGNTVEFWLKKTAFVDDKTGSEVIFDSHTTDFAEGNAKYGRFLIELDSGANSPFYVTYMSGTAGPNRAQLGQNVTDASVADSSFHHYAITSHYSNSSLTLELYVDGVYNHSVSTAAASFGPVPGYFNAALGSLRAQKDTSGGLGYGKLSGQLDEFRFWKEKRTAEQIGNYYDFPVNGATDKESINSVLGIYYKFNEGVLGTAATDKIILDYSGRVNNGEFIGYTSQARSTDSAITLSSASTQTEIGDPIINPASPKVIASLKVLTDLGKAFDKNNNNSLFQSLPHWAAEHEDSANQNNDFSIILQAIAQKFDSIRMLIDGIPKIGFAQYKDFVYAKGTHDHADNFYNILGCDRDFNIAFASMFSEENFSVQNLLGKGFTIEESPITDRADLHEYFYNLKFDIVDSKSAAANVLIHSKSENLKNKILNSIHTNLSKIYKTKGTADSFRNLIRCFGVDENLIAPNVYGQNIEKEIKNEPVFEAAEIKSLSFTGSNNSVTLHQTAAASDERAYIEGKTSPASFTLESKVLFPFILDNTTATTTTSIFGMNQVNGAGLAVTSPNYSGIEVASIKSSAGNRGAYFQLKSKGSIFSDLKTDYFREVYANTPWYLSVRFTEDTLSPLLNSDGKVTQSYKVEFIGYRYDLDVKASDFHLSASITAAAYQNFISGNKSVFLGANREGITGTLIEISDVKHLSFSVWDDFLEKEEMQEHAQSFDNLGRTKPLFSKVDNQGASRLRSDTLILNWQFDNVTKTNATTNYIFDHASGSATNISAYGSIVGYKYPAVTYNLQNQAASIQQEYLPNIKYLSVDNLASRSKVEIKAREVEVFQLDSRPISYLHSYEKSMYQAISKEMMNMLAGASAFNNLIGEPLYKYRQEYKSLEKLREKFFARVENEIDLERFIEYYKWIDSSLASLLRQLQPATSAMNLGLEDVVESHVLERSKYKHQAPQLEYKDPKLVGQILGINELLYDWEHGHAPSPIFWGAFDGTDDYIEVTDHNNFSFGDAANDFVFSLSAWVVFSGATTSTQAIAGKYNANTASEYLLFNNNGYLQANLYDLNTSNKIQSKTNSVVFEDGKLYHVAIVYDASTNASGITLYIDGVAPAQTKTSAGSYTAMHDTSTAFQIGSTVAGTLDFARNIHHVMVFDSDLSAAAVSELYKIYNKGVLNVTSANFSAHANIVSWWRLDQKDYVSGIAKDSIGSHNGTLNGDAHIAKEYIFFGKETENCLWWNDRAERDKILTVSTSTDPDREDLRQRRNTVVSGSTYVLRRLTKPYKFSSDRQALLNVGSNRNANKNKFLHSAIVNVGKEIQINSSDIYAFKQCSDVLNPQEEKIYTAKTNTSGTEGYLDADADMIFPFSLYSSSVGTDFSNFKGNLSITNNHDDRSFSFQGPFVREHVGGMPHRRVKFRTATIDRPEAYALSASSTTLTLKAATGPKSLTSRGMGLQTAYNITNIKTKTATTPRILGNYSKDYEIVLTNGRSANNSYLVESGSIVTTPIALGYVSGTIDFASPIRGRAEHIIANQFSSPGGPETQGVYGRDKESGEYSIYNTLNYRNLSVRQPLNLLSKEKSEQLGYRSGSTTQASIHMTNRNYFHSTGAHGEISTPDNQFVQHPIPQNDFGYSWIAASAINTKFDFVNRNDGFGHQHMFSTGSAKSIQFLSASIIGSQNWASTFNLGVSTSETVSLSPLLFNGDKHAFGGERDQDMGGVETYGGFIPVDFIGLNTTIAEPLDTEQNILGFEEMEINLEIFAPSYDGYISADVNYVNSEFNEIIQTTTLPYDRLGNTINYGVTVLNSIILNRQGPYGWPTWKQLRGGEHPIIRAHRKTNTFSRVFLGDPTVGTSSILKAQNTPSMNLYAQMKLGTLDAYARARLADDQITSTQSRLVKNYIDVVATSRFSPARIVIHGSTAPTGMPLDAEAGTDHRLPQFFLETARHSDRLNQKSRESNWYLDAFYYRGKNIPANRVLSHRESFQNDLTTFANMEIAEDTRYKERDHHSFLTYAGNLLRRNTITIDADRLIEINYIESIYPREINTFTRNARERVNFDYFPWKATRSSRNLLLTGNIRHNVDKTLLSIPTLRAFPWYASLNLKDYKKSVFGNYDIVRMGVPALTSSIALEIKSHINTSTWLLDSRKDFSDTPTDINRSYFTLGTKFLTSSLAAQGTRGEGILQNDFSTFPLGYNNLYGTPPFSTVYNRRIPQSYTTSSYLAGEAKWQAADDTRGPFYDSYTEYSEEIKLVAPDHSLIPEFRISEFTEQVLAEERSYPNIGADYLILTGAIYQNSSGDADIGGKFFKTYSNSDFLKYFSLYDEEIAGDANDPINNISHARINFKCKAAMKFLPYKGFYPAERALEVAELFQAHYLNPTLINTAPIVKPPADLSREDAKRYANLRANASRYQAAKPLFGPGVLFNSIKSGVAVDYPIFYGNFANVYTNMHASTAITSFTALNIPIDSTFTGSIINSTQDPGIPRIKSYTTKRIYFEDLMSPVNLFGENIYDNEPHPSASLIYGTDHWHRIIERPGIFGNINTADASERIGLQFKNTKEAFSRQMAPYTMAMQNFAAETVNFFVEDGHLTTAMSKPVKERFVSGQVYKMKARITNVENVMYDRHSAFGPPVDDGGAHPGVNLTTYAAPTPGAAAAVSFTFTDWATHNAAAATAFTGITAVNANNILPSISWNGEGGSGGSLTFYHSDHYTPTLDGPKNLYVNLKNVTTGTDIATAFSNSFALSASVVTGWQLETSAIAAATTMTSTLIGVKEDLTWSLNAWKAAGVDYTWEGTFLAGGVGSIVLSNGSNASTTAWTSTTTTSRFEHGHMPYVPPFLDPGASPYVEISFAPTETKEFGAKEIIENSTFSYFNFDKIPSNAATNTNYKHSMSLSASLNLGMCVELRTDNIETNWLDGAAIVKERVDVNERLSRWVIQTKWETPVLNFANATASALNLNTRTVTAVSGSPWKQKYWGSYYDRGRPRDGVTTGPFLTASTGIWHQKGEALTTANSTGYFLKIEDVPRADKQPGLAKKLGFNQGIQSSVAGLKKAKRYRNKVGAIENRKLVKEAIVAIPYIIREDLDNKMEFIQFSRDYYEKALKNVQDIKKSAEDRVISDNIRTIAQYRDFLKDLDIKTKTFQSDAPVNAIEYQLFMMNDYVLPPHLDFLKTSQEHQKGNDLSPFMMYFFQFHASFDREDLANIWQNLYPKSATSTASPRYSYTNEDLQGRIRAHDDISYVSHYLETTRLNGSSFSPADTPRNLFSPTDPRNKTRWLIFKVKQRAKSNLETIRRSSIDPRESNIEKLEYLAGSKISFSEDTLPADLPGTLVDGRQDIQFNWPYDYFSFVELIKLETKIDSYNYND